MERAPAPTIDTRIRQAREDLRAAITRQRRPSPPHLST